MKYAIINKANHLVQEVREASANLSEMDTLYEVATDFAFQPNLTPDIYEYRDETFKLLSAYTLVSISRTWRTAYADYKLARVALFTAMMMKGGFEALEPEEKRIASAWFIVGRAERDSVHTTEEQIANGRSYNANSIAARKFRLVKCMMEVYNRLSQHEVNEVVTAMNFARTAYNYTELGQEGTIEGNDEGLFDYIQARVGTTWETTGLKVQSYIPTGMSDCAALADKLIDILKNGNY